MARSPRFVGLRPASRDTSRVAAAASRKRGTKCEVKLWRAARKLGLKFTTNVSSLPGCPDLVFEGARVAVFVDGDFWHGRKLANRIAKLSSGHNSEYWIQKIRSNVARDRRVRRRLRSLGWRVIRVWESEINSSIDLVTSRIAGAVTVRAIRGKNGGKPSTRVQALDRS
jgi:DNA mismatch endonuclease (patch repair protein)